MISNIDELKKIDFEKIEEDEFWNQSDQKELSIHKVHVYPAKFPCCFLLLLASALMIKRN